MKYHDITVNDMKNGDGLRVVLWVSGCSHHCKGCHNSITWDPDDGEEFTTDTMNELIESLKPDYISGLTLSGGDPLYTQNRDDILPLLRDIRSKFIDKSIWVYTGYQWEELIASEDYTTHTILEFIDVLVDGPFIEQLKDSKYQWAGSTNQRVIDVQKSLKEGRIILHESH